MRFRLKVKGDNLCGFGRTIVGKLRLLDLILAVSRKTNTVNRLITE